ncbi:MAG: ABC transporter substrate-binding protein, partial [Chloroflexi bacterium]|nr:ABC transporter substrate-binding protein [Chloroflexota bacterium]
MAVKKHPGLRFLALVLLAFVAIPLVVGCAKGTKAPTPTTTAPKATTTAAPKTTPTVSGPSGTLNVAVNTLGVGSMDPIKDDGPAATVMGLMYDWMFRMVAGEIAPGIVEKWEIASDGLSWTFNVRRGVKFQDGTDVTANDVKFSIERYKAKEAYGSNVRTSVDRVELVDTYTLKVITTGPKPFLPTYLTDIAQVQGLVMPKDYFEKNGLDNFMQRPMGSGQFSFVKYVQGDSIQLTAKDSHWLGAPAFKTLNIVIIPDESTRVAMLKSGSADVIGVSLDNAVQLEKTGFTTYPMVASQARIQFHGTYDPRAKGMPTSDIKVRQALITAINASEVSKTLFFGKGLDLMPAQVPYASYNMTTDYWVQYTKQFYKFDTAKAKSLLADAGYPSGFSGIKLYVTVQPGTEYIAKLAEIVQSYWKQIGVNADVVPLEMANYQTYRREPADALVGAATFGTTANLAPAVTNLETLWGGKGVNPLTARISPQGTQVFIPELDKLVYSAMTEMDSAKRNALTAQATKMAMDTYTAFGFAPV